jgi:hypothetical protein
VGACGVPTLDEHPAASVMAATADRAAVPTTSLCVRQVIVAP